MRYYVTPLIEGKSLNKILDRQKRLSIDEALMVATAVADALRYAHTNSIIHRDLKPSNILIPTSSNGLQYNDALAMDFGVVGQLDAAGHTQMGQIFGTPKYMSPEQITGGRQSPATDVYGLGLLLYEMIFGQPAFQGDTAYRLIQCILNDEVAIPDRPVIRDDLQRFIQVCLSKDQGARPKFPHRELLRIQQEVLDPGPAFLDCFSEDEPQAETQRKRRKNRVRPGESASKRVGYPFWIAIVIGVVAAFLFLAGLLATSFYPQFEIGVPTSDAIADILAGSRETIIGIAVGVSLAVGGIILGGFLRARLRKKRGSVRDEAGSILFGLNTRADLSTTIALEVEELITKCKAVDERILGKTVALMIDEYRNASTLDDRTRALVTAVQFLEKLTARLTPWYIKCEKLIVAIVSLLGVVTGGLTILDTLAGV